MHWNTDMNKQKHTSDKVNKEFVLRRKLKKCEHIRVHVFVTNVSCKKNASICKFITRHDFSGINYYMVYDLVYI